MRTHKCNGVEIDLIADASELFSESSSHNPWIRIPKLLSIAKAVIIFRYIIATADKMTPRIRIEQTESQGNPEYLRQILEVLNELIAQVETLTINFEALVIDLRNVEKRFEAYPVPYLADDFDD
jgi:hypothetical protein